MPTPSYPRIFIHMHEAEHGAPWCYTEWKERTGILHGLFPDDDQHLPNMSRADNDAIKSWFSAYINKSHDERASFASSKNQDRYTGRTIWAKWIARHLPIWQFQQSVDRVLRDCSVHPAILTKALGTTSADVHDANVAFGPLCRELFGEERCVKINGALRCKPAWRAIISNIVTKAFERITHCLATLRKQAYQSADKAEALVEGESLSTFHTIYHSCSQENITDRFCDSEEVDKTML